MISEICREYGCLPSEAERELAESPGYPLALWIMTMRRFAETYRAYKDPNVKKEDRMRLRQSPHYDLIEELDFSRAEPSQGGVE